ncbi:Aspartate aminotransferase [compost metagenome]
MLRACEAIDIACPEGAFYLLPRIKTIKDDQAFALTMLEEGVATVPGSAFGMPGHLRLSFATDESILIAGCERLVQKIKASV